MEKKDYVRNFIYKYIDKDSKCVHETITKYVGVNKALIRKDKKEIIEFYRSNFLIFGNTVSYDDLRHDAYSNEWIRLDNRRDLELFENLLAVGYEAGVFEDNISYRFVNTQILKRHELKYAFPEEFEYLDDDYYNGLNKGIIQKNRVVIDTSSFYDNVERSFSIKELLEYWFTTNNLPVAKDCEPFYYYLNKEEELMLNVATYLYMKGCGPISLLMELNHNINTNLLTIVQYAFNECDEEVKKDFLEVREQFLNMLEASYKTSIIRKKKGLN